jgi:hypothetical protein
MTGSKRKPGYSPSDPGLMRDVTPKNFASASVQMLAVINTCLEPDVCSQMLTLYQPPAF